MEAEHPRNPLELWPTSPQSAGNPVRAAPVTLRVPDGPLCDLELEWCRARGQKVRRLAYDGRGGTERTRARVLDRVMALRRTSWRSGAGVPDLFCSRIFQRLLRRSAPSDTSGARTVARGFIHDHVNKVTCGKGLGGSFPPQSQSSARSTDPAHVPGAGDVRGLDALELAELDHKLAGTVGRCNRALGLVRLHVLPRGVNRRPKWVMLDKNFAAICVSVRFPMCEGSACVLLGIS